MAGLAEVQPWVEQWHGEVDPDFGVSLAAFCREQLTARAAQVGKALEDLAAWRPEPPARGRRAGRLPRKPVDLDSGTGSSGSSTGPRSSADSPSRPGSPSNPGPL